MRIRRRDFLKHSGLLAATVRLPGTTAPGASAMATESPTQNFSKGFLWGVATAAYQVEGAANQEGRGPSIWDTFSHSPGNTHDGDTGDVSTDHFHRFKEDVALMRRLGVKAYRFSISWSRVFPHGGGRPNAQGLDFYKRLLDELHGAQIEPFCTMYHWDLPQALGDKGGWQNRETCKAFADYCGYVSAQLSDRIRHFMTMNEIRTFIEDGYRRGSHPPQLKLEADAVAQVYHNVVLAHGMGVQALRASAKSAVSIGIADVPYSITPVLDTPDHVRAARKAMREENASVLTVILEGRYTDAYTNRLGGAAPVTTAEELKTISTPLDFIGLNIYTPTYVRASESESGYAVVPPSENYPHMLSKWLYIGPDAMYWTPKLCHDIWNVDSMFITENGCSADDQTNTDGKFYDTDRIMYLRAYLTQLQRAIAEGVPVNGYFLWSLLDNFEWSSGYSLRFGLTHVDYKTLRRTPKLSFEYYREVITRNGVS